MANWQIETSQPLPDRCVVVGAPHTSGWDVPITFLIMGATGVRFRYLAKDSLFKGPLGWFFHWTGGIPVNRSRSENLVDKLVHMFHTTDKLQLAIAPEGTRKNAPYWRTGFYHIAHRAGVPIVMGFADYLKRTAGWGPMFNPSGNIHVDFEKIKSFYQNIVGRHPHKTGVLQLKDGQPAESHRAEE